jgi:hypothetical protein
LREPSFVADVLAQVVGADVHQLDAVEGAYVIVAAGGRRWQV